LQCFQINNLLVCALSNGDISSDLGIGKARHLKFYVLIDVEER